MTGPTTPEHDRTEPVDIQHEMQRSFIDYAMSVIVSRALPDVRDGLKPVHRRVLYGMYDSGFRPDTRTATRRSTTPWSGWPSRGRCATR